MNTMKGFTFLSLVPMPAGKWWSRSSTMLLQRWRGPQKVMTWKFPWSLFESKMKQQQNLLPPAQVFFRSSATASEKSGWRRKRESRPIQRSPNFLALPAKRVAA